MRNVTLPALPAIRVFYSEDLISEPLSAVSPSGGKPKSVFDALMGTGWAIEQVAPEPVDVVDLCRVHDPMFVEEVLGRLRSNGFGSREFSVARSLPYTSGACVGAALVALRDGISASLTSGFHHAGPHGPRAFCTFNGLMVAAVKLLDLGRVQRVAILDCDFHYGDGTQAILDAQGLSDRVLHISLGERYRRPERAAAYLAELEALRERFAAFAPDLIFYQAGADLHVDDPLGGVLTTDQMRQRDRLVFHTARTLGIPLTWNLAGGYQVERDGSIPRVVALHLNTFEEALRVWQLL